MRRDLSFNCFQLCQNVKAILRKEDVAQGLPASRPLTSTLLKIRGVPQRSTAVVATDFPYSVTAGNTLSCLASPLMNPIFGHRRINYFEDEKTETQKCNFSFNEWTSQTGISLLVLYLLSLLRDHIAQRHAN